MHSRSLSTSVRACIMIPYVVIENVMASKVYRDLKLQIRDPDSYSQTETPTLPINFAPPPRGLSFASSQTGH